MARLGDLARLIRSKNAGAFMLTFDVMFDDDATEAAKAIKISIPRPYIQGARDDGDAYGGQQHAPLVELELPD